MQTKSALRHSRAGGNPGRDGKRNRWVQACAGMTLRVRVHLKFNVGHTESLAQIEKLRALDSFSHPKVFVARIS
jgi:hypothetical protein